MKWAKTCWARREYKKLKNVPIQLRMDLWDGCKGAKSMRWPHVACIPSFFPTQLGTTLREG